MDRDLNEFELKRIAKYAEQTESPFDFENEIVRIDENTSYTFDEWNEIVEKGEAARGSDVDQEKLRKYFELLKSANELAAKDKHVLKVETNKPTDDVPSADVSIVYSVFTNIGEQNDFHKDLFTLIDKADFFSIGIHEPYTIMVRLMVDNIWKDWG